MAQNEFLGNKKQLEECENNNNFNHYSPNFSAGSLKAISPFYNPTPNLHSNSGVSNYFMFSNNILGTPLKSSNNVHNINFQIYGGVNSNSGSNLVPYTNPISSTAINTNNFNDDNIKNPKESEDSLIVGNNNFTISNQPLSSMNISNLNPHPTIIIPKINLKDDPNMIGIPTPGRNLGFYSWVIHGSPVLHNNPLVNNIVTQNNKNQKKRKNVKKSEN